MDKTSVTKDAELDREFFSPPDPRGGKSFLRAFPPFGIAVTVATGILIYKVKMWPKMKAKGENVHTYFWNTRWLFCATIAAGTAWTLAISEILAKQQRKELNITEEDRRLAQYGDHKPRKLPVLKLKPYEGNPMALFKTNILEQVLLERFNAKSQSD